MRNARREERGGREAGERREGQEAEERRDKRFRDNFGIDRVGSRGVTEKEREDTEGEREDREKRKRVGGDGKGRNSDGV
jgi:hypothetical protein